MSTPNCLYVWIFLFWCAWMWCICNNKNFWIRNPLINSFFKKKKKKPDASAILERLSWHCSSFTLINQWFFIENVTVLCSRNDVRWVEHMIWWNWWAADDWSLAANLVIWCSNTVIIINCICSSGSQPAFIFTQFSWEKSYFNYYNYFIYGVFIV